MSIVLRPESPAQAQEMLRESAGSRVAIAGAGTAREWGGALDSVDTTLETTALDSILSYQPTDLTVAVRAGVPLARLQQVLAEQGQQVALDAARIPAGATAGGLLATGDAGPARLAYGSLRDLVIGVTVLLADGTLARSGGQVIKNVAGYDLAKLFHGSLGTLGVVVAMVLRLHPLPPATATLAIECDWADCLALAGRLQQELEPVALEWCGGRLLARFEGTESGLAARGRLARRLAGGDADWRMPGGDELWKLPAAVATGRPGDTVLRLGTQPAHGPWLAKWVADLARATGSTADLSSSVLVGVHQVRLRGGAGSQAEFVTRLRDEVAACGGTATICRWADGLPGQVPAWGEPPAALPLLRAVKHAFDPGGRLGPGRFAPWF